MARGTGKTTKQMTEATLGALFVSCHDGAISYVRHLAVKLGRDDLEIVGPSYIFSMTWHGRRFTGIVVDHALEFRKQQKYLGHQLLDTMRAMVR